MIAGCHHLNSTSQCYLHYVASENMLFNCLSDNTTYSPYIFPLMGQLLSSNYSMNNETMLEIGITVVIYKLLALTNDKKLSVVVDLTFTWFDPNIKCPQVKNVVEVFAPSTTVWSPEFKLLNPASSNVSFSVDSLLSIYPSGNGSKVRAYLTASFHTVCSSMNFLKFPFDSETCNIMLTVMNGRRRISYLPSRVVKVAPGASSSEWLLLGAEVSTWTTPELRHGYQGFNITLRLQRESFYYVLHLLIPIIVSESLIALVLLLPTDQGSKVKLGAIVMLNVYVLQNSVVAVLPHIKRHEIPNIVVALYVGFLISVASLAESVFFHTVHILVPGLPSGLNSFVVWLFVTRWRSERDQSLDSSQQYVPIANNENDTIQQDRGQAITGSREQAAAEGNLSLWVLERILESLQNVQGLTKRRAELKEVQMKQDELQSQQKQKKKLVMMAWKRCEYASSLLLLSIHVSFMVYFFGYYMYI